MTGQASKGLGLALVSSACFSTAGSFARSLAGAGWSPAAEVAVRAFIAAAILLVPALRELRGRWSLLRGNGALILTYGAVTVAGCQLAYFNAVQHLAVGIALLLEYLGIVLIVVWLWWRGQRPRRLTVIGSIVALAGLALVIDLFGDRRFEAIGVVWGLCAAVGLAVYFLLSSRGGTDLPPTVLACGGMIVGGLVLVVAGLARLAPLHASLAPVELAGHHTSWLVPALGLGTIAAAIAYVAGIHAARLLGAKLASFVSLTEIIFAVLVAWLLLGELPTASQLVGGLVIVVGVTLVRVDELRWPRNITPLVDMAVSKLSP